MRGPLGIVRGSSSSDAEPLQPKKHGRSLIISYELKWLTQPINARIVGAMGRARVAAMDLDAVHSNSFRTLGSRAVFGHRAAEFGSRSVSLASEERERASSLRIASVFTAPTPRVLRRAIAPRRALGSTSIYQHCPMVMPQPSPLNGPNSEEWCRALDCSPRFGADRRQALTAGQPGGITLPHGLLASLDPGHRTPISITVADQDRRHD